MSRPVDCDCSYVDIGVGEIREPNSACPVHGADDQAAADLVAELERDLHRTPADDPDFDLSDLGGEG